MLQYVFIMRLTMFFLALVHMTLVKSVGLCETC